MAKCYRIVGDSRRLSSCETLSNDGVCILIELTCLE